MLHVYAEKWYKQHGSLVQPRRNLILLSHTIRNLIVMYRDHGNCSPRSVYIFFFNVRLGEVLSSTTEGPHVTCGTPLSLHVSAVAPEEAASRTRSDSRFPESKNCLSDENESKQIRFLNCMRCTSLTVEIYSVTYCQLRQPSMTQKHIETGIGSLKKIKDPSKSGFMGEVHRP